MSLSLCGCKRVSDRKLELEKLPFAFIEWFEILFLGGQKSLKIVLLEIQPSFCYTSEVGS